MFSTMPRTGTSTLRNMLRPLRASINARSCGVETMIAPDSGTCWAMVSCTSPVPGGMSITSTSRSPQSTSRSIWVSARTTIGPRQMIGRALIDQEAHRHGLEAVGLHGPQLFAAATCGRPLGRAAAAAKDHRCRIENADLETDAPASRAQGSPPLSICRRRLCPTPPRSYAGRRRPYPCHAPAVPPTPAAAAHARWPWREPRARAGSRGRGRRAGGRPRACVRRLARPSHG